MRREFSKTREISQLVRLLVSQLKQVHIQEKENFMEAENMKFDRSRREMCKKNQWRSQCSNQLWGFIPPISEFGIYIITRMNVQCKSVGCILYVYLYNNFYRNIIFYSVHNFSFCNEPPSLPKYATGETCNKVCEHTIKSLFYWRRKNGRVT